MTFEERREEYYNLLRSNTELLYKIIKDNKKNEKGLEILLTPKNDRELEVAKCIFKFFDSAINLFNDINYDRVNNIDIENNESLGLLIRVINTLKEENEEKIKEIDKYLNETLNPLFAAKLMYDLIIAFSMDIEESYELLMKRTGFNPDDELDNARFQVYLNIANAMVNTKKVDIKLDESTVNSKEVSDTMIMINEFNRLCEDGLKDVYKKKLTNE